MKTSMNLKLTALTATAALMAAGAAQDAQSAVIIIGPPDTVTASSEFSGSFAVGNMFNNSVSESDIDTTTYSKSGGEAYAGSGTGPHDVWMDFSSSISTDGFAYAARSAQGISSIEFFFRDSASYNGVDLGTLTADVTVSSIVDDDVLNGYALGATYSGQYVGMRVNGSNGNPGGNEFRFTAVPEPSSLALLGLGGLCVLRRRRG